MTEQEWLTSTDPEHLLTWLQKSKRHRPTRRKLGLFAGACTGRLGDRIAKNGFADRGLALAESMAEGLACEEDVYDFQRERTERASSTVYDLIAAMTVDVLDPNATLFGDFSPEDAAR